MQSLLSLQDISYAYHNLKGETPALSHISFEVSQGEFLAIVGPSGCGNAMVKFWKLCLPLRFIFHPQERQESPVLIVHRAQTVDKVPGVNPGFSLFKSQKSGKYEDFPALFWYNESIKTKAVLLLMMTQNADKKREQIQMFCMDDMVPQDHLLRIIDKAIDWSFIYGLVEDRYSPDNGRPSMDPVMLIKIPFIQYLYGIKSMRQTVKEIEVNVAYRWFLGLEMTDKVPHFSTFGKNYTRRFKDTDLFEQIFSHILQECYRFRLIDPGEVFVDATHVKARANNKKMQKRIAREEALFFEEILKKEINEDREAHGKRPLKEKDDDTDDPSCGGTGGKEEKTVRVSTSDPESGWFRKGEHKNVFAYTVQTACDKNGWVLGYSVHPGNHHDSRTFKALYDKIKDIGIETLIADAGYKTPGIAKLLIDDGITPLLPYKRPMTKKGFFLKHEYVYDEYYDCYICPDGKLLTYHTTNRDGYREYKSSGAVCAGCPYLAQCTQSKDHVKTVTRHIWEPYMEMCEDIRHTLGMKELYSFRKETIERIFGTAKENHGFRYTQMYGKARMEMKAGLTFACMNLKKLAKMKVKMGLIEAGHTITQLLYAYFPFKIRKALLA